MNTPESLRYHPAAIPGAVPPLDREIVRYPLSFAGATYRSVQEYLSVAFPVARPDMTNIVVLGCNEGFEFLPLRSAFPNAVIHGVDCDQDLYESEDLIRNIILSGAGFLEADYGNIGAILSHTGKPDLIWVRHPGPFEEYAGKIQYAVPYGMFTRAVTPWVRYVQHSSGSLLQISFYGYEQRVRRSVRTTLMQEFDSDIEITAFDKRYYGIGTLYISEDNRERVQPDYYGLSVRAKAADGDVSAG